MRGGQYFVAQLPVQQVKVVPQMASHVLANNKLLLAGAKEKSCLHLDGKSMPCYIQASSSA